jgi:hypothetical protein
MNVSTKVQHIWWATMRCGSRSFSEIMKHYGFFNYHHSKVYSESTCLKKISHTHECNVPAEYSHYPIIMQVRNPYSRAVSIWHLSCFRNFKKTLKVSQDFEEYVLTNKGAIMDSYEHAAQKHKPTYIIKYENMQEDIKKLPFLDLNNPEVLRDYNNNILRNNYKYEGVDDERGDIKRDVQDNRFSDWRSYYSSNPKLAEIIYEKYKGQFELFGYDKDSWK